jgi:DNA-binding beta-propeller fold protein YncE
VDTKRRLVFVLDGQGRTVLVYRMNGDLRGTIGRRGTGTEALQNPTGLAVDPLRREVLISDYGDPRTSDPPAIKIFSYGGAFVGAISGKSGMLGRRFSRPQGLAVDGADHVFVTEAVAGEVIVLDRETGATLKTLGALGVGPGELWLPLDVAVDSDLNVLVVNNRLGRIEIFERGGEIP